MKKKNDEKPRKEELRSLICDLLFVQYTPPHFCVVIWQWRDGGERGAIVEVVNLTKGELGYLYIVPGLL